MRTNSTAQAIVLSRPLLCLTLLTVFVSGRVALAQTGTNVVAIDAGGTASGIWLADEDFRW
jgi:hypothetical protein